MIDITHEEWVQQAERRFGRSLRAMRFRCPVCGHVQSGQDFLDLGMTPGQAASRVYFSCIGRWTAGARKAFGDGVGGPGPCDFTNGGLLRLGPIRVTNEDGDQVYAFDFADEPLAPVAATAEAHR